MWRKRVRFNQLNKVERVQTYNHGRTSHTHEGGCPFFYFKMAEEEKAKPVSEEEWKAFMGDYSELAKKHGIDIVAYLDTTVNGITPKLTLIRLKNERKNELPEKA